MKKLLLILGLLLVSSPVYAAARFLVACTTACTWDNSSTAIWSTTSGGAPGSAAPVAGDAVTLDANSCVGGLTCTITVNANLSFTSLTFGACTASTTGCILDFSANNNTVTATSTISITGTGTRTLNMGNGTWTLSLNSSTVWNATTTTNMTFNANSSTILFSGATASNRNFIGGALTYNDLSIAANSSGGTLAISNANTFAHLLVAAPNGIVFTQGVTQTISNAFTWTGSSGSEIGLFSSTFSATATISVASGSPTMSWAGLRDITFSGGATFTATNSFDLGHNSGITITAPASGGSSGGFIIGG